ncbi:MAG: hypothetical protein LLG06_20470 [Desulfobacteraceae bacterium]|nr:hypothetical protein [Desulfobacteraceae bacterium]
MPERRPGPVRLLREALAAPQAAANRIQTKIEVTAVEHLTPDILTQFVSNFGIPGIIFVVWYFSEKSHEKTLLSYREDTLQQQKRFEEGLAEVRRMYENNVRLVEAYQELSSDLQNVVILNTQAITQLSGEVRTNQYCPPVRAKRSGGGEQ